jgi:hypothetical protein
MLLVIGAAGCAGGALKPVQGTVKLDGQPLAGASVLFIAEDPAGRNATGFTDPSGTFRLSTYEPNDGALPGKYKVVVQPPTPAAPDAPRTSTPDEAQRAATVAESRVAITLPGRYSRPDQTVLVQEVPPQGPVAFELESK